MIIVEGPDGTGKTTLIQHLAKHFSLPIHERFSDSIQGPIGNMYERGAQDIMTWPLQDMSIYDRHPFISDPIYAPIMRHEINTNFWHPEGRALFHDLVNHSLTIFCDPGWQEFNKNLTQSSDMQMDGVMVNMQQIYNGYAMTFARWPRLEPMSAARYNYTRDDDLIRVENLVDHHLTYHKAAAGKYHNA